MPQPKSQADIIVHGEGLLEAAARTPEIQQAVEPERQALAESVGEVKVLKARQEELTALRQEVTQLLKGAIGRVKDASIVFRSAVRAKIGPRSERLVHFKIAPLRKRSRRQVVVEVEKKLNGEASGTQPDASAPPSTKPVV